MGAFLQISGEKMEVQYWSGGLTSHEVDAIERMSSTFTNDTRQLPVKVRGFDSLKKRQSMFPWKAYAGFRFVDIKERKEGEFDLVIITHCNVLIIELKHWNGVVTCCDDKWYLNDREMGRSPVSITRNKKFLLEKKLERLKPKLTNREYRPRVHFFIVMTGHTDFSQLSEQEKEYVFTLDDFLKFKDETLFNNYFRPHSKSKTLNQDWKVLDDELFGSNNVKPKSINMNGYYAEDIPIFSHPKNIYQEFLAQTENTKYQDQALLRRWDFNKISDSKAKTPDGRYHLISREYDILNYIKLHNEGLYHSCLTYKSTPQRSEVTAEYIELFELLPQQKRFNQFVGGYNGENLSLERRLGLIQLLLNKFAQLHKINIAHRDIGEHSIWLSADDKIILSGFSTAYFSSEQTIGDIRKILEVSGDLAKDAFPVPSSLKLTPYQYDIRSLAVLAWHIIHAKRISSDSMNEMKEKLVQETFWYSEILRRALSGEFANAEAFLDTFKQNKPRDSVSFPFEFSKLDPFTYDINHSRAYREDNGDFIIESSEKEVYRSNGLLVKAWLNADPHNDERKARDVLRWLESVSKLRQLSPGYIPRISEFGIAKKSGCLFLVSDFIEGISWSQLQEDDLSEEDKFALIHQFIVDVEHLHGSGFTHGDLKPDNVLVKKEQDSFQIYILDMLDFCASGQNQFNTAYSPEFDCITDKQRDNFAVMKMACELLGILWNTSSEHYPDIADSVRQEYLDNRTAFISLARFREALVPKPTIPQLNIMVGGRERFSPVAIYPDNGELFVRLKIIDEEYVKVSFIGLGGILTASYNIADEQFVHIKVPSEQNYISKKDRDNSNISLALRLNITHGNYTETDKLNQLLAADENLRKAVDELVSQEIAKKTENIILEEDDILDEEEYIVDESDAVDDLFIDGMAINTVVSQRPSIQRLWQAILDTETEALPSISVSGDLQKTEKGGVYIPYEGEVNPLDQFNKEEIVDAIGMSDDGEKIFKYGTVDILKSTLNEIHLKDFKEKNIQRIAFDAPIYFQSRLNKASFIRRKNALQRILDGESVIKDLASYFDENCTLSANKYDIQVSEEEFSRYNQPEKRVSLNEDQRKAFQKLVNNGPLSLLQGPPGTGKTEFISAFVHYLFDIQKVRNILLVSQSHEAVNTAAERIRKHCRRLGTNLQLVRFSNREVADSEALEDVFSPNLVGQKREQLNVDKIDNICALGRAMGLHESYLRERSEIAFSIGVQIRGYEKIVRNNKNGDFDKDELNLQKKLEQYIREQARHMGVEESLNIVEILPRMIANLDRKYNIQPNESNQANKLIELTQDMLEALSNERTNYDEFLARSRQLVVGTCVGIGQKHIGIADNIYDWVIIDEAARSISSELAIAMQSGTRILLVGDHKQLPPLYSEAHKKALARRLGISKRGEELEQALGSDFERVFLSQYGKQTCAVLKTQYRMAPAIGSLVSACFYDNELENGKQDKDVPNIYDGLSNQLKASVTWLDTSLLPDSYHEQGSNGSIFNRAEADVIINILQDLADDPTFMNSEIVCQCLEKNEQAIGVICMYVEQKKLISKKFNERNWDESFRRLVKIDSVDSYQGKENRFIILSLSRHDKSHSAGFLYLPNRINVALSRAMDKLVIVGAKEVWEAQANRKTPLARVLRFIKHQDNSQHYAVYTLKGVGLNK